MRVLSFLVQWVLKDDELLASFLRGWMLEGGVVCAELGLCCTVLYLVFMCQINLFCSLASHVLLPYHCEAEPFISSGAILATLASSLSN